MFSWRTDEKYLLSPNTHLICSTGYYTVPEANKKIDETAQMTL